MKWAATALLSCLSVWAQISSIEGLTVDSTTGEPLPGVHVRLVTGNVAEFTLAYGAMSDRTGKFSVAIIRPGTYIPFIERTGYLFTPDPEKGTPHFTIRPGQKLTGVRIELTPRAVLSGRVVDELGDPVENTWITILSADPDAPPPSYGAVPYTNDRGEFRIIAPPGRYYLQAGPRNSFVPQGRGEIKENGVVMAPYVATFYPSSVSKLDATSVEATAGKEIPNLEIRLVRHRGVNISGIIRNLPENTPVLINVHRETNSQSGSFGNGAGPEGRFEIPNVEPGHYVIQASAINKSLYSDSLDLQVNSSDITGLELRLTPGGEIDGALQIEGGSLAALGGKPVIRLAPVGPSFNSIGGGEIDSEGAFHLNHISPGKYRIGLQQFLETAYLKKLEVEGSVVSDGVLDLDHGSRSPHIKLTVSLHGATLGGHILDEDGQPLLNPIARVILLPAGAKEPLSPESFGQIDADGRYSFRNVRPGRYRIAALDPSHLNRSAPLNIASYAEKGEEIEIQEDARLSKDLHLLPKEGAHAKPPQQ